MSAGTHKGCGSTQPLPFDLLLLLLLLLLLVLLHWCCCGCCCCQGFWTAGCRLIASNVLTCATDGRLTGDTIEPNKLMLEAMDTLLTHCKSKGLRLILTLTNYMKDFGGMQQYARWASQATASQAMALQTRITWWITSLQGLRLLKLLYVLPLETMM
jgi:hypothetical protein